MTSKHQRYDNTHAATIAELITPYMESDAWSCAQGQGCALHATFLGFRDQGDADMAAYVIECLGH